MKLTNTLKIQAHTAEITLLLLFACLSLVSLGDITTSIIFGVLVIARFLSSISNVVFMRLYNNVQFSGIMSTESQRYMTLTMSIYMLSTALVYWYGTHTVLTHVYFALCVLDFMTSLVLIFLVRYSKK